MATYIDEMEQQDIHRTYQNSFLFIKENDIQIPILIRNTEEDDDTENVVINYQRMNNNYVEICKTTNLSTLLRPEIDFGNWYDDNNKIYYYVQYNITTSYRRGILWDRINIFKINGKPKPHPVVFTTEQQFRYLYDKLNKIRKMGVIDRDLCIIKNTVYFRALPLGLIENKKLITDIELPKEIVNKILDHE